MTDTTTPEVGRHSRWSAAALLAPASAAVFAGTMGWTADHDPVLPSTPAAATNTALTSAAVQGEHKSSPRDKDLERQIRAQVAQVRTMRRQVAALRKDVAALRGKAPGTGTTTPPTGGATTPAPAPTGTAPAPAPTSTKPAPAPTTTKPAPAPTTTKPAPAPAPTTTASTGGS
ncbi:MAG: hypothetical protein IPJ14_12515 [Kineosporiaceae bacterium]|nr:hypothetical protein [Kineosporiaceae bacterium]